MRRTPILVLLTCLTGATGGCHSAFVQTTITNKTSQPLQLIELDYPSASFGTQNLAPGATFHYRFKVLGSGPTKLLYTDSSHRDHTAPGPTLKEGDEGILLIDIDATGPQWQMKPK